MDFQGLFRGLAAIGYAGPLTFESFSSAVVSPSLSNTLCVWRNLCAGPTTKHRPPPDCCPLAAADALGWPRYALMGFFCT